MAPACACHWTPPPLRKKKHGPPCECPLPPLQRRNTARAIDMEGVVGFWGSHQLSLFLGGSSQGSLSTPPPPPQESPPTPFGTERSVNHLEERLLGQAQARAAYTPLFWGHSRSIPQGMIFDVQPLVKSLFCPIRPSPNGFFDFEASIP